MRERELQPRCYEGAFFLPKMGLEDGERERECECEREREGNLTEPRWINIVGGIDKKKKLNIYLVQLTFGEIYGKLKYIRIGI
jgi:hypothetical protein